MTLADTKAFKALVETVPALTGRTFVSKALLPAPNESTKIDPPYAVIHPADGFDAAQRFTGPIDTTNPRFTLHTVGVTAEQAQALADLVKAKLIVDGFGVVVAVAGRRNEKMSYSSPIPVQVDESVTPSLPYHVAECGWRSHPAT